MIIINKANVMLTQLRRPCSRQKGDGRVISISLMSLDSFIRHTHIWSSVARGTSVTPPPPLPSCILCLCSVCFYSWMWSSKNRVIRWRQVIIGGWGPVVAGSWSWSCRIRVRQCRIGRRDFDHVGWRWVTSRRSMWLYPFVTTPAAQDYAE